MGTRMVALIGFALLLPDAARLLGSDLLVIFGSGNTGRWVTELALANPGLATLQGDVRNSFVPASCQTPPPCSLRYVIPPRGSIAIGVPETGVGITYIDGGHQPPQASAAVVDLSNGGRAADLPVFHLMTLFGWNPDRLVFPGVTKNATGYTNLQLANLADPTSDTGGSVSLLVEVIDSAGVVLAVKDVHLEYGESAFITDICAVLGATVSGGQLSVSRLDGTGHFWGIAPIVRTDGSVSVVLGLQP